MRHCTSIFAVNYKTSLTTLTRPSACLHGRAHSRNSYHLFRRPFYARGSCMQSVKFRSVIHLFFSCTRAWPPRMAVRAASGKIKCTCIDVNMFKKKKVSTFRPNCSTGTGTCLHTCLHTCFAKSDYKFWGYHAHVDTIVWA